MKVTRIEFEYDEEENLVLISMKIDDGYYEKYEVSVHRDRLDQEFDITLKLPRSQLKLKEFEELERYVKDPFKVIKEKICDEILKEVTK